MTRSQYDVTISVWNDFHSLELCEGLHRNGFSVQALRSEKKPHLSCPCQHSELSRILTRLFQRMHHPFLLELAQDTLQKNKAKKLFANAVPPIVRGHSGACPKFMPTWGGAQKISFR